MCCQKRGTRTQSRKPTRAWNHAPSTERGITNWSHGRWSRQQRKHLTTHLVLSGTSKAVITSLSNPLTRTARTARTKSEKREFREAKISKLVHGFNLNPSWGEPPAKIFAVMPSFWRNFKQTFIYCRPVVRLCAEGGGGRWRTCGMRYDEPRRVWTSLIAVRVPKCVRAVRVQFVSVD